MTVAFSDAELDRYARQLVLREIGGAGQQKLKAARVLIVGAGGLGSPAALYLAAAGVGVIGLADPDEVAVSNLQRQILFGLENVGLPKVEAGAARLAELNPFVKVRPLRARIDSSNAAEVAAGFDLVLDGTDDFASRFAVNAGCYAASRALVSGAIGRWAGQVAVFEAGLTRGRPLAERKPCYQCLVREAPPEAETCAAVGILGALAGVVGAMMAAEAVKLITGAGEPLSGRLLLYDALTAEARTVALHPDPRCPVCGTA
ncbi:MAG TPA: molybdopterin-synthase adenylyltransferase MoeB [Caulobacteraceae bacterium]|jgi:molybdopterin/thiamine biosynthesis adenylyltransferase